jgi:hypothetical protein
LVLTTTGKISTREKLIMYYITQNNYLATNGNSSCYDAKSASHRPLTVSGLGGVGHGGLICSSHETGGKKMLHLNSLHSGHLGFSLPVSFNESSIIAIHSSITYAVATRPIYSAVYSVFK